MVRKYTTNRFGTYSAGDVLNEEESKLLTGIPLYPSGLKNIPTAEANMIFFAEDYVYHTLASKASGELCLKYIFSFGAFARSPLLNRCVLKHIIRKKKTVYDGNSVTLLFVLLVKCIGMESANQFYIRC